MTTGLQQWGGELAIGSAGTREFVVPVSTDQFVASALSANG
jgi:hypothetical protein